MSAFLSAQGTLSSGTPLAPLFMLPYPLLPYPPSRRPLLLNPGLGVERVQEGLALVLEVLCLELLGLQELKSSCLQRILIVCLQDLHRGSPVRIVERMQDLVVETTSFLHLLSILGRFLLIVLHMHPINHQTLQPPGTLVRAQHRGALNLCENDVDVSCSIFTSMFFDIHLR